MILHYRLNPCDMNNDNLQVTSNKAKVNCKKCRKRPKPKKIRSVTFHYFGKDYDFEFNTHTRSFTITPLTRRADLFVGSDNKIYEKELLNFCKQITDGSHKGVIITHKMNGLYYDKPVGNSMDIKECLIEIPAKNLKVGDVIFVALCFQGVSGVIHRITKIYRNKVVTKGDNCDKEDIITFHRSAVIGKVVKAWS